jgi:tetratricopeptide (TPR) repeat protein
VTDMPRRPRQHDLQTASIRAFESALPDNWDSYAHGDAVEYGIDRDVEIFADGHPTGLLFHVQIKATENLQGKPPKVRVKRRTWNYWRGLDLPVLVVLWERATGNISWTWSHDHDTYGTDPGTNSLTIALERPWDDTTPGNIAAVVRSWRAWRYAADHFPIPITVTATGNVGAVTGTQVVAEFRRLALLHPQILAIQSVPADGLHFAVTIGPDKSVVQPFGSASATVHHDDPVTPADDDSRQHFAATLASDLLLALAALLARFGSTGPAARLAATAAHRSSIVLRPTIAGDTVGLLFEGGRIDDAVELLGRLIQADDPAIGAAVMVATMWASARVSGSDRMKVVDMLESCAAAHEAANDPKGLAGTFTYNAAWFSADTDVQRTIRLYDLAAERQPAYRRRAYWQRERAGSNFNGGHFEEAVAGYEAAVALGDSTARGLLADAHMFAGNYAEALRIFRDIEGTENDWAPEWMIKRRVLTYLIDRYGLDRQERNPAEADDIAASTDDPEELRRTLIENDLLCGHAHWKLAIRAADNGQPAFDEYLTAAASTPEEPAPWFSALLCSAAEEPDMCEVIAITARRMAGHAIIDLVLTSDMADAEERADEIEQLFNALPPDPPGTLALRVVGQDPDEVAVVDVVCAFEATDD